MTDWTEEQREYISSMAEDYGLEEDLAFMLADLLGPDELYDGFVTNLQDSFFSI